MIGRKHDGRPAFRYRIFDIVENEAPEERPAEIEFAANIAVRFDDTWRRLRHDGKVEAAIHALERDDLARMLCAVQAAGKGRTGRTELGAHLPIALENELRQIDRLLHHDAGKCTTECGT